jgi:hypothetical protein
MNDYITYSDPTFHQDTQATQPTCSVVLCFCLAMVASVSVLASRTRAVLSRALALGNEYCAMYSRAAVSAGVP